MKRAALLISLIGLAACQAPGPISIPGITRAPQSAEEALEPYYRGLPDDYSPEAPPGLPLPSADTPLTRILVGSCLDEEKGDSESLRSVAAMTADLFLMIGDNVYGDSDGSAPRMGDADLPELRESFSDLAARPDFQAVRKAHPMMVAWDDHDYALSDGGKHFAFRRESERIHERFWGLANQDVGAWPGTYYARAFGPEGERTQIIMLDTRFFRSDLTDTDDASVKGKERYMPSSDPNQDMLGNDQWTWLQNELQKPADLRLIVSSVQVMPNAHGWESWSRLPAERERLYDLIKDTGADGVVFVSGDRHAAFLYRADDVLPYPAYEITASSFNASHRDSTDEMDVDQIGPGYSKENFGSLDINWPEGTVTLSIHASDGATVEEATDKFR